MDKAALFKESNRLFISRQYALSLPLLYEYGKLLELTDLERLRNKKNIADCLLEIHQGQGNGAWTAEFTQNLTEYWQLLEQVDLDLISPEPTLRFFDVTLQFHLEMDPLEKLRDDARASYGQFSRRSRRKVQGKEVVKVRDEEFLAVAVAAIERERRRFARPDHAQRAAKLAEAVLREIGGDDRFRAHRAAVYNLLADLAYFFPLASEKDNERYQRVSGYVKQALQASPHDEFARIFKDHVDRLAATTLQIKRFGHDTSDRLANLRGLLDRLERTAAPGSEFHQTVLAMRREIRGLKVLGRLVERQEPAMGDWQKVDPTELVGPLLEERGWPASCVRTSAAPAPWQLCPDYLHIALENLLRNTVEAYGRKHVELPTEPCRIAIDYDARSITIRDWAGGIDPNLGDVFEPYVSSKGIHSDTGLGLTQIRVALKAQDPRFSIALTEPQPTDGAEFRLRFPPLE